MRDSDNYELEHYSSNRAMRRILVENARRKQRLQHGGSCDRQDLDDAALAAEIPQRDETVLQSLADRLTREIEQRS